MTSLSQAKYAIQSLPNTSTGQTPSKLALVGGPVIHPAAGCNLTSLDHNLDDCVKECAVCHKLAAAEMCQAQQANWHPTNETMMEVCNKVVLDTAG